MAETFTRARCVSCGKGLPYEAWSHGQSACDNCLRLTRLAGPAATYVRGPAASRAPAAQRPRAPAAADAAAAYERALDEMPDELVDELVAALEAEMDRIEREKTPEGPVHEVLRELGFNRSQRDGQWAAWGFAAGFAANVVLAKYTQIASGGSMAEFAGPLLIGGIVAGATCSAIGWGLARLRGQ
jgi:hypothetical protein